MQKWIYIKNSLQIIMNFSFNEIKFTFKKNKLKKYNKKVY